MQKQLAIEFALFFILFCRISFVGSAELFGVQAVSMSTVSVSPSTVTKPLSQNFTIDVIVSGVADLFGWEFQLGWNSTFVDAVNASEGPFLRAGGSTFFTYTVNATAGSIIVDCTLTGSIPGVSGDGRLGTLTFYAKSVGKCPLDLHDVILVDSHEQSIALQSVNGYLYVTSSQVHDIAITKVTSLLITVLPGAVVNINVTVQNDGNFAEVFNVTVYANSLVIGVQSVSLGAGSLTTIIFAWNTTGFGKGDYTILASASAVPEEVNVANNTKVADISFTILTSGHDVAVTHVDPTKTAIGRGYSFNITVGVKNYGVFGETFNVTARINSSIVETRTVTVASGETTELVFVKNTSSMTEGKYTLSANATVVPGETDSSNNNVNDASVFVTIPGDVNGDGSVNIYDAITFAAAFNSLPGSISWNSNADINGDNGVDVFDAILLSSNFGKTIS